MSDYDVVVIGAGPGGYVAAIRAAQLGLKAAVVEKRETFGGTCLNVGCIPSKALLESSELYAQASGGMAGHGILVGDVGLDLDAMMERKASVVRKLAGGVASLLKANGIDTYTGCGTLLAADRVRVAGEGADVELAARHVVLAAGSVPVELPAFPFDGERIIDSTGALSLAGVPGKFLVIGAGAVGIEMACVWSRLGAQVTIVELMPEILPGWDVATAQALHKILKKQGITIHTGLKVVEQSASGDGIRVTAERDDGSTVQFPADRVLVSVGRRPCTDGLGLEALGLSPDPKTRRIPTDKRLGTAVKGVYAIGDLVDGPMLAHKAEEEGVAVAETIAGKAGHVNYATIPSVVYTHPEVASVGATEEELKAEGVGYAGGVFTFAANGRAIAAGHTDGFAKILADRATDRVLGVHVIGPSASELVAEAVTLMEFGGSAEDLARTVHAHPTLSEAMKEAACAVDARAIHVPPRRARAS